MKTHEKIRQLADWVLPPQWFRLLTFYKPSAVAFALKHREVLARNQALHQRHAGARCFILCNGPSVKQQDIAPLKNEIVFSVSNGYLHADYPAIAPRYHCLPQITYSEKMTPEVVIAWFREMHEKLGAAELILDCQEWQLVQQHGLFEGRKVHYVCMGKRYFANDPSPLPDLASILPRAQSAPIMALMIALAMGFKEIYLLGTDHDWFVKKEYRYAFGPTIFQGKDQGVTAEGIIESKLLDDLPMVERLWSQYRAVGRIAEAYGARIYNATAGGMLDEFPRVDFAQVVKR